MKSMERVLQKQICSKNMITEVKMKKIQRQNQKASQKKRLRT